MTATEKRIQVGSIVRRLTRSLTLPPRLETTTAPIGIVLHKRPLPAGSGDRDVVHSPWKIYWFKKKEVYWFFEDELELIL